MTDHKAMREALEKATPGPWMVSEATTKCPLGDCTRITLWTYEVDELPKDDYYLASKAPEWLRQLLDENEALEMRLHKEWNQWAKIGSEYAEKIEQLQADKAVADELRQEVLWFAGQMEQTLRKNDHKGGWKECTFDWLVYRLYQETNELWRELKLRPQNYTEIIKESSDVANFALMIADLARTTLERLEGTGQSG